MRDQPVGNLVGDEHLPGLVASCGGGGTAS